MKKLLKTTILILMGILSVFKLEAQEKSINNQIQVIPYVFEGVIEKVEIYAGDKKGNKVSESATKLEDGVEYYIQPDGNRAIGFSITTIKLCKVYKGSDIENQEKIYLITSSPDLMVYKQDGQLRYMNFHNAHSTEVVYMPSSVGSRNIFFCNKNENNHLTIYNKDLSISFNNNFTEQTTGVTKSNTPVEFASGFGKVFYSKTELNVFLSSIPTINVNAKDKCVLLQKKSLNVLENVEEPIIKINYEQNLENYSKWLQFTLDRKNNTASNKTSKVAATDLTLEIANARMVGADAAPWFEFDVLVSANTTTYFDNCLMRIQYNTSAFNSNVVANSNIQITRAPAFNNSTYTTPQTDVIDQTSNTIGLPFGTNFSASTWSRTQINSTPQVMLSVRFKIQSCNQFANINYTDVSFTPMFSYYAANANDNIVNGVNFDNTSYNGSVTDKTCIPIINGFNNYVPAGTNQILTITGKYFGLGKGAGTVIFKDANLGTVYPALGGANNGGIQQYDVVSWTHDEIQIKIPGTIDSSSVLPPIPGSGKFKVKTRYSQTVESSSALSIPYAVFSYADILPSYRKVPMQLSGLNNNGYVVHLHPNVVSTFPDAKAVIRKAMKDWNCVSSINWKIGSDTAIASSNDGLCMINVGSFSALQRTVRTPGVCPLPSGNVYYLKSFDIEIKNPFSNPAYSWQVDTVGSLASNKYDFYHAIAHELGHAHLLEHANDTLGDVMFWSAWNGPYPAAQRKTVAGSSGAPSGGLYVTTNLSGNLTCAGNQILLPPTNCTGAAIGVKEISNPLSVSIFPNPSAPNQDLIIKLDLQNENIVHFQMFDITGKLLKVSQSDKAKTIEHVFSTEGIEAGIYLLKINLGNQQQTVKIIKQ